jgi:hypothetical protein
MAGRRSIQQSGFPDFQTRVNFNSFEEEEINHNSYFFLKTATEVHFTTAQKDSRRK